jgi:hypothetical protein
MVERTISVHENLLALAANVFKLRHESLEIAGGRLDQCSAWLSKSLADIERDVGEGVKDKDTPVTDEDSLVADGHHASVAADLLAESGRFPDRASALHFLMNSTRGAAMLQRLRSTKRKQGPMSSRTQDLQSVVKHAGDVIKFAKFLCDEGNTHGVTEHELVSLIGEHDCQPGESTAKCFARHYGAQTPDGLALRKAVRIAKETMPIVADYTDVRIADQGDVQHGNPRPPAQARSYRLVVGTSARWLSRTHDQGSDRAHDAGRGGDSAPRPAYTTWPLEGGEEI